MRINPKALLVLLFFPLLQGCPAGVAIQVANVGAPIAGKMVGKIVTGIGSHVSSDNSSTSYSYRPSSSSTSLHALCILALDRSTGTWDYSTDVFRRKVEEAKAQGVSEQDCAQNLGLRTTTVEIRKPKKATAGLILTSADNLHQISTKTICKTSLKRDGTEWDLSTPYFSERVKEAKSRGLSEQDCTRILGRTTAITVTEEERQKVAYEKYKIKREAEEEERRRLSIPKTLGIPQTRSKIETSYREQGLGEISPISSSTSSSLKSETNYMICHKALSINVTRWKWNAYFRLWVNEAKSRGLSKRDCARLLSNYNKCKSAEASLKLGRELGDLLLSNGYVKLFSPSGWKTYIAKNSLDQVSTQECARLLGGESALVSSGDIEIKESNSSNKLIGDSLDNINLCKKSTKISEDNSIRWGGSFNSYVRTAKSRGLSEQDCARILGETTTVVSKPDPQPSLALVKRTQEALKSLGLYRGSVDGVAGVQSKSALKQWQKSAGLNATGEIKEDQIAQLESDALEELANQERERKAKAKRVAEANRIKNPDAIAVIIGNRDYKGDTPDVEFAVNDADAMREFVLNKLGYRSGNIIDLRDATQAELLSAFGSDKSHKGTLFDYVRADESDVIVFYSGHGVPGLSDRRGYLLSVDANPNKAELTGYPVDTLLKNLAKIPTKSMTVFIDACFSGNTPKGMLVDAMSGLTVEIRQPKKVTKGMVVLTASRGDQVASWDKTAKHGLFTKHLLEALNGAADKQSKTGNKDGKVTLGEVKAYLDREMTYQARRRFSRDQHATVSGDLKTVLSAY